MRKIPAAILIFAGIILGRPGEPAFAAPVQSGFEEQLVFSGLNQPSAVRFSPDGRVFVAEKRGVIKVFDSLSDTTPTIFADLRTNVYNFWDRGLLGMALDPGFPTKPYIYVLYAYDAAIGGTAPRWGTANTDSDPCPTPPGPTDDGCIASGRLSRLQAAGNVMTGSEQVLIEDWCQQYPSHSIGSIVFGPDGALYVSGGDGASFGFADWGQDGNPVNPCGDPPGAPGTALTPPTAEGGALRSQDLRTSGDPVSLDGAILRVNPDTGAALPNNPLIANSDDNAKRIIAYGLRNPFRTTIRPGTNELWLGDVGWGEWEEINKIDNPTDANVENFGWPCYEGRNRQGGYDAANLNICEALYGTANAHTEPYYTYHHNAKVVPNESCPVGSSSIAGLAFQFYTGGPYPPEYDGALFFADYSRDCVWVMYNGLDGKPNASNIKTFLAPAANPVDLQVSPDGELYWADFDGGAIRKVRYTGTSNQLPSPWEQGDIGSVAIAGGASYSNNTFTINASGWDIWSTADSFRYVYQPLNGDGEITARVTALQNTDPWAKAGVMIREDLTPGSRHAFMALTTGNGTAFQRRTTTGGQSDHTAGAATTAPYWVRLTRSGNTYTGFYSDNGTSWTQAGTVSISLPAAAYMGLALTSHSANLNTSTFDNVNTSAGTSDNEPPIPTISTPTSDTTWKAGDTISFSGSATDPEDGNLTAGKLTWTLIMHHCPSNCHTHTIQSWDGIAAGNFSAPDHEYPSHLELKLIAADSKGATGSSSVLLQPVTVVLNFATIPTSGLQLAVNGVSSASPFEKTVIVNSNNSISASSPQTLNSKQYDFVSWSDGGAATHNINAPAADTTLTAEFKETDTGGSTNGLTAIYFDNIDFSGSSINRVDTTINFDWGDGSADPAIGPDTFSARWTGQVLAQKTETYTFYTMSDDGVRLWVNDQQIINNWTDHPPTENSGQIALTAGAMYDIKMEYYENFGGAAAKLSWSSPTTTKQIIPQTQLFTTSSPAAPTPTPTPTPTLPPTGSGDGITGQYYDNRDLTNLKITRTDPLVNFGWGGGSPGPGIANNTYSARWSGFVVPLYSQTYTFYTTTDDGVRLWVNDQLLIDKWVDQAAKEWSGTIPLTAGQKYSIKMEYFESFGGAESRLRWSSASQAKEIIPKQQLFTQ